ncbi:MAG: hypothetical protein ACTHMY_08745, partial [Solirubrobacteraceae bacterium]
MFREALRCHVATWGGCGNLVLPTPGNGGADADLFWALLDVYDPDTVHGLPTSQSLVATGLGAEFEEHLGKRLAPLTTVAGVPGLRYDASDPPHWPLTSSEKVRPLPDELVLKTDWPAEDLALMNAATRGEMSPRLIDAVRKAGVKVREHKVDPASMWTDAIVPGQGAPMWSLAGIGLESMVYSGTEPSGLVLCAGDDPWDFGRAHALERLGVPARRAPPNTSDELKARHPYAT